MAESWDFAICINTAKTLKSLSVKERKETENLNFCDLEIPLFPPSPLCITSLSLSLYVQILLPRAVRPLEGTRVISELQNAGVGRSSVDTVQSSYELRVGGASF